MEKPNNCLRLCQIHHRARNHNVETLLRNILEEGVDINAELNEPNKGPTLGHEAASKRNTWFLEILLKYGADITLTCKNQNETILHKYLNNDYFSLKPRYSTLVNSILSLHVDRKIAVNPTCKRGISHFHIACAVDHIGAVDFFFKHVRVPVDQAVNMDSSVWPGYTALHVAAEKSNVETVKLLLDHGAKINLKNAKGMTPTQLIIKSYEYLGLSEIESNMLRYETRKVWKRNETIIRMMIENGEESLTNYVDGYGLTALHIACSFGDTSLVKKLLNSGADVNASIKQASPFCGGYTPLHFALWLNMESAKLLLENGANLFHRDATSENSLWDWCVERLSIREIHWILSVQKSCRDITSTDGRARLLDVVLAMESGKKFDALLSETNDNVNISIPPDSPVWPGYTPLHVAIAVTKKGNLNDRYQQFDSVEQKIACPRTEIIEKCLSNGADVDAQDAFGTSPIHLAFELNDQVTLRLLRAKSRSMVNLRNSDGLTYLHTIGNEDKTYDEAMVARLLNANKNCKVAHINSSTSKSYRRLKKEAPMAFVPAGSTPLHLAVQTLNPELVKLLLDNGADPCIGNACGMTPIHTMITAPSDSQVLDVLFSFPKNLKNVVYEKLGLSHLHVAAYAGNLNAFRELLRKEIVRDEKKADHVCEYERSFWIFTSQYCNSTILFYALISRKGDRIVDFIIESDFPIELTKENNCMLLNGRNNLSVENVWKKFAKKLLKYRNRRNVQNYMNQTGFTALHLLCLSQDSVIDFLENEEYDVNAQIHVEPWIGYTPLAIILHDKTRSKCPFGDEMEKVIELFLKNGADVTITDRSNNTLIHKLYRGNQKNYSKTIDTFPDNYEKFMNLLLDGQRDYTKNPADNHGLSHFHIAITVKNVAVVKKFLNSGAKIDHQMNLFEPVHAGYTPLHFAVSLKFVEIVNLLMKSSHGLDFLRTEDINGDTPLHVALRTTPIVWEVVRILISSGADVNAKNIEHRTPLEVLLISNETPIESEHIKFLLKHGCRVNVINRITSEGILHSALGRNGDANKDANRYQDVSPIFKQLLGACDIRGYDEHGQSSIQNLLLHESLHLFGWDKYPHGKAVERLIEIGCDVNHQNNKGKTALHLAMTAKRHMIPDVVEVLLSHGADINITDNAGESPMSCCACPKVMGGTSFEILRSHVSKMKYVGLCVSELNLKKLDEGKKYLDFRVNDGDKSEPHQKDFEEYIKEKCDPELEKLKCIRVGTLNMKDFMFTPKMMIRCIVRRQDSSVDDFIELFDGSIYPNLEIILRAQYRKAKYLKFVFDVLTSVFHQLPELCSEIILNYL